MVTKRINLLTLGVADLDKSTELYQSGLGWRPQDIVCRNIRTAPGRRSSWTTERRFVCTKGNLTAM